MSESPTVHERMIAVLSEVEGIGKTSENKQQHYNFRGIEVTLQALHPLFAEHGLLIVPDVIDHHDEPIVSSGGSPGHRVLLHVRYTIYGAGGDSITLSTYGEAIDYSDKGHNKAMTAAFKYALFEAFMICDPAEDGDQDSPDGGEEKDTPGRGQDFEMTPLDKLAQILGDSGFLVGVQHSIIDAAVGRTVHRLSDLTDSEIPIAVAAIEAAIVDAAQREEDQ